MAQEYEGHCTGGPYNGHFLSWPHKRYVVAVASRPPLESYGLDDPHDHMAIGYSCYNYNLGHWIWQDNVAYPGD